MSRLIGRKLLMRLGSGGGGESCAPIYRLLPRRAKSDRLLESGPALVGRYGLAGNLGSFQTFG